MRHVSFVNKVVSVKVNTLTITKATHVL